MEETINRRSIGTFRFQRCSGSGGRCVFAAETQKLNSSVGCPMPPLQLNERRWRGLHAKQTQKWSRRQPEAFFRRSTWNTASHHPHHSSSSSSPTSPSPSLDSFLFPLTYLLTHSLRGSMKLLGRLVGSKFHRIFGEILRIPRGRIFPPLRLPFPCTQVGARQRNPPEKRPARSRRESCH